MRRIAAALLACLLLAGCSSDADGASAPDLPAESAFREGTCRLAAPDLREVGRLLPRLGDDATVDKKVQQSLADTQDRLFALSQGAEPRYAPLFAGLVERIGAVRIRSVGNTYEPVLGKNLRRSYDDVVTACTAD